MAIEILQDKVIPSCLDKHFHGQATLPYIAQFPGSEGATAKTDQAKGSGKAAGLGKGINKELEIFHSSPVTHVEEIGLYNQRLGILVPARGKEQPR